MDFSSLPAFWYAILQFGVGVTFALTALRVWKHSRERFVELATAFLFGLLLIGLLIHGFFLAAVIATGIYLGAPLLLVVALTLLALELEITRGWVPGFAFDAIDPLRQNCAGARLK